MKQKRQKITLNERQALLLAAFIVLGSLFCLLGVVAEMWFIFTQR